MPHHRLRPRKIAPMPTSHTTYRTIQQKPALPRQVRTDRCVPEALDEHGSAGVDGHASPEFSRCYHRTQVFDASGNQKEVEFECTISRGFFKVKEDWICYRRNYISVTAALVQPSPDSIYARLQEYHKVTDLAFVISAVTASDPPRPVDLVQHTPKRDKGPQRSPQFIQIQRPASSAVWDRLQYKTATANNGKKRGQQYFSIKVTLFGYIESPDAMYKSWVELADKFSEPMIVRGRSPGHYNDSDGPQESSSSPECDDSTSINEKDEQSGIDEISPQQQFVGPGGTVNHYGWFQSLTTPHNPARSDVPGVLPYTAPWSFNPPNRADTESVNWVGGSTGCSSIAVTSERSALRNAPLRSMPEDDCIVLAPLRLQDHDSSTSRCERLPTYDELSQLGSSKTLVSSPTTTTEVEGSTVAQQGSATTAEESPELQAALSLASICTFDPTHQSAVTQTTCPQVTQVQQGTTASIAGRLKRGSGSGSADTLLRPSRKSPRHSLMNT